MAENTKKTKEVVEEVKADVVEEKKNFLEKAKTFVVEHKGVVIGTTVAVAAGIGGAILGKNSAIKSIATDEIAADFVEVMEDAVEESIQ